MTDSVNRFRRERHVARDVAVPIVVIAVVVAVKFPSLHVVSLLDVPFHVIGLRRAQIHPKGQVRKEPKLRREGLARPVERVDAVVVSHSQKQKGCVLGRLDGMVAAFLLNFAVFAVFFVFVIAGVLFLDVECSSLVLAWVGEDHVQDVLFQVPAGSHACVCLGGW